MSAAAEISEVAILPVATDALPKETPNVEQGNVVPVVDVPESAEGDQPIEGEKSEEAAIEEGEIQDSVMEDAGDEVKKEAVEVYAVAEEEEAVPAATEGKAEEEAAAVEAGEEAVPDVKEEAQGVMEVKKDEAEEDAAKEPQAKKQRTDGAPATSGSPSCDADANKQEEDAKTSSHERKEDAKSVRNSDRDTPPASEEPRSHRSARGSSRKAVASRQLINKNFLKAVLPNITRLSRTEILQDLRMMEGNAKTSRA